MHHTGKFCVLNASGRLVARDVLDVTPLLLQLLLQLFDVYFVE